MPIDLHAHSYLSDGTDSPAQLVAAAAAAGLDVVALTDHDVTAGWAEADLAGQRHGVTVIPGIEVSCSSGGVGVHLLGYLFDPSHEELNRELARARSSRLGRIRAMAEALAADGFPVSYQAVLEQAVGDATLGRPHLADALVAAGVYPDRTAAFAEVLHRSSRYYVAHYAPETVRTVRLLREAGGVTVLAHPLAGERGSVVAESVIEQLAAAGLAGLEMDHRDHPPQARQRAAELCRRLGLLATGSSDYHGAGKPNRLGEHTTDPAVFARLLEQAHGSPVLGAPLASSG